MLSWLAHPLGRRFRRPQDARQPPPVIPIGDGPTRRAYLRTVRRLSRAKASKRKHAHAGRARAPEWREAATLCWPRARTWSRRSWRRLALHEGRCPSRREIALVIASLPGRPSQGAAAGSPPGRPREGFVVVKRSADVGPVARMPRRGWSPSTGEPSNARGCEHTQDFALQHPNASGVALKVVSQEPCVFNCREVAILVNQVQHCFLSSD